jgi:hypothetical protein
VVRAFGEAIGLSGTHDDEAVIGGKTGVVGVDGVERKMGGWRQFDDFRAG